MIDGLARRPWSHYVAMVSAITLVALSALVFIGWVFRIPAFVQILPTMPPMTRNTALCFGLSGTALLLLVQDRARQVVLVCSCLAGLVGILTLFEILSKVDLGIDQMLGSSFISVNLRTPGRMAPLTAVCFSLSSVALIVVATASTVRSSLVVGLVGSVVTAFGAAAFVGYWGGVTLAALHTSCGLVALGAGMLALVWRIEGNPTPTPTWLPFSVVVGVSSGIVGLWRALTLGGYPPFSLLPFVVLAVGFLLAPIFGLTVYLAQRGHAQASELRRSAAFLHEAQHLSRTGSFSWNVGAETASFSLQASRIFGFSPEAQVSLERVRETTHPDDAHLFLAMAQMAGRGDDLDQVYRLRLVDGTVKHVHLVAHRNERQEMLVYIGAVQDITDRQLSEEALDQLRSELARVARMTSLGTLTASIAHEVNQPLAGIVTNAGTCLRMLASDPPNVDGARDTAKRTIRDANRASDVIKRLRALFVKAAAEHESLDLSEATLEVTALLSNELQRNYVLLRTELAGDLPSINGDRVQLQQVIMNLLMNAADAMVTVEDRPRQLIVSTMRDGSSRVRLTVEDVGTGFPPADADKLFEAFYTTKNRGMGIGLSVSRSIVERHKGLLWAMPNTGPGATFAFSIPHSMESSVERGADISNQVAAASSVQHASGKRS